ncbi:diphthine methyl ester synthase [Paramuricea clavata]|uniref:Diphthine methyl ester synthase n=1 Tax=Paramuricea clavata TaxID=317549 RepID=A0A7D9ERZ0_PARCT|nr:diphthine methyl ester synthase [Paramuricea clavata]
MTVRQAADQLLEILRNREFTKQPCYEENTLCVGLSRVGCHDQKIVCTTLKEMKDADIGEPLHSLVIPGKLHFLEIEMLKLIHQIICVDARLCSLKPLKVVERNENFFLPNVNNTSFGLWSIIVCDRRSFNDKILVGQMMKTIFYERAQRFEEQKRIKMAPPVAPEFLKRNEPTHIFQACPFGVCMQATTHTDLVLRARKQGIAYTVIHNASIINAVGCCGLQLYNFGETVSIVFWEESWKPDSFYDKIALNLRNGLHTLCLLGNLYNY